MTSSSYQRFSPPFTSPELRCYYDKTTALSLNEKTVVFSAIWFVFCLSSQVGLKAIYEIAKIKNAETHSVLLPLESVCKSVRATALSMGLEIVDDREGLKKKTVAL